MGVCVCVYVYVYLVLVNMCTKMTKLEIPSFAHLKMWQESQKLKAVT